MCSYLRVIPLLRCLHHGRNEDLWSTLAVATCAVRQTPINNLLIPLAHHLVAATDGLSPVGRMLGVVLLVPRLLEFSTNGLPVLNEVEVDEEVVGLLANHHWSIKPFLHVLESCLVLELLPSLVLVGSDGLHGKVEPAALLLHETHCLC